MKIETVEQARKHFAQAISMGATLEVKASAGHKGADIYDAVQYVDIDKNGFSQRKALRAKYGWKEVAPAPAEAKPKRRTKKVEE